MVIFVGCTMVCVGLVVKGADLEDDVQRHMIEAGTFGVVIVDSADGVRRSWVDQHRVDPCNTRSCHTGVHSTAGKRRCRFTKDGIVENVVPYSSFDAGLCLR